MLLSSFSLYVINHGRQTSNYYATDILEYDNKLEVDTELVTISYISCQMINSDIAVL